MPSAISATSDNVFAEVKTFWINLPSSSPRVFTNVSNKMIMIATNCCVERLTAYLCESMIGGTIHRVGEMHGAARREISQMLLRRRRWFRSGSREIASSHREIPKADICFAQVHILAAGARHHRGEFAIAERRRQP